MHISPYEQDNAVVHGTAGAVSYTHLDVYKRQAKAFACRGSVVAMLHEAGEESSRVVDCLPGGNHFGMSGCLGHPPDLDVYKRQDPGRLSRWNS